MRRLILCFFIFLMIPAPDIGPVGETLAHLNSNNCYSRIEQNITPMKALDLVKERYADNFDKYYEEAKVNYYYKSAIANYYLAYEGEDEAGKAYLIHLYEFVTDDQEAGLGHIYTYGWYSVDKMSGNIIEKME